MKKSPEGGGAAKGKGKDWSPPIVGSGGAKKASAGASTTASPPSKAVLETASDDLAAAATPPPPPAAKQPPRAGPKASESPPPIYRCDHNSKKKIAICNCYAFSSESIESRRKRHERNLLTAKVISQLEKFKKTHDKKFLFGKPFQRRRIK